MDRIALVNMPFVSSGRPAIGISLLKAALKRQAISCDIHYLNFDFARCIGCDTYEHICETTSDTWLGEYVFAQGVFGDRIPSPSSYSADILVPTLRGGRSDASSGAHAEELSSWVRLLGEHANLFLDRCLTSIPWSQYRLVGFTTTFHQTTASLALARRLKAEQPHLAIVFGGANCEAEMGRALHRLFPFIDYVCSGEADLSFPALAGQILQGNGVADIPGVVRRVADQSLFPAQSGAPVHDLDALPIPDYDDYVEQRRRVLALDDPPQLLFEGARGCWWGQKSHCTFCGLNGETMQFRAKSPQRTLDEIEDLARRYDTPKIAAVDNIMPMSYFQDVLPRLVSKDLGLDMFYETKANLKREQVRSLREAGVLVIQPGIESLSSDVLRIMKKGVTCTQNLQLLRWCAEFMIEVKWNILAGFAGELPEHYARQAEIVPLVVHLPPPLDCGLLRVDRFSPIFSRPREHGLEHVRPRRAYRYVFPFDGETLHDLAYFFDFDYMVERDPNAYTLDLQARVKEWFALYQHASLVSLVVGDELRIWDTRPAAVMREHHLSGAHRLVYEYCDEARTRRALEDRGVDGLDGILSDLVDAKLLLHEDNRWLSLAVSGEYQVEVLASHLATGTPLPFRCSGPLTRLYQTVPDVVQALVAHRVHGAARAVNDPSDEAPRPRTAQTFKLRPP